MPSEDKFASGADEGHYLLYSKYLSETGIANYPDFFDKRIQDRENWIWPSPLRAGYFLLSTVWVKVFGPSFRALASLSFVSYILFLLICLYFSKRYFGWEVSCPFVLLLSFSPLAMAMAKRALSDSVANVFIALSVWLFLHFLSKKKISNFALFIIFYTYSILVREQAIIFICFFSLFFLLYRYVYKAEVSLAYLPALILLPVFNVGLVWLVSSGNFNNLAVMFKLTRILPTINEYSILYCRGPWFRYIIDYLLISPLPAILALAFIIYTLAQRQPLKDYKVSYFLALFFITYILLSSFDYNKNIRYALSLDMPLRLFTVLMLREVFKKSKFTRDYVFFAVLCLCIIDYFNFSHLFCRSNIYDPVSFGLLQSRGFIPSKLLILR